MCSCSCSLSKLGQITQDVKCKMNLTVEYFYNKYYPNTFGAEHIGNLSLYEVKQEYFKEPK